MKEIWIEALIILAAFALLSVAAALFALALAAYWASAARRRIWRLGADWHERHRSRLSRERK